MRTQRWLGEWRRFRRGLIAPLRDQRGAILILTAVAMPVLLLVIGFAADYGYASYINQRLARAADASAISAVSQDAATAVGGYSNLYALGYLGSALFTENIKQLPVSGVTSSVNVVSDGNGGVVATASYSYSVKTFFGGVIGRSTIPISGSVVSTAKPETYINYYILVDGSQSMGIATSQADMINLYNRVVQNNNGSGGETGCVFGCHVPAQTNGVTQTYSNEDMAHNITKNFGSKITLRIDSAVTAVQTIISTAASIAGTTQNIKFALYVIQADPTKTASYLKQIAPPPSPPATSAPPSSDYASLQTLATSIDLGNNTSGGIGDTDYVNEFTAFGLNLPANGSGSSAASPKNFVFLITDGVTDTYGTSCLYNHCTSPLDSSKCTALKSKATVGVIYTTYLPVQKDPNNPKTPPDLESNYAQFVDPISSQIAPALQACATSSSYYFEATEGSDIINAMQVLFNSTLPITSRLVQ